MCALKLILKGTALTFGSIVAGTAALVEYKSLTPQEDRLNVALDLDLTLIKSYHKSTWDRMHPALFEDMDKKIEVPSTSSVTIHEYMIVARPLSPLVLSLLSRFANLHLFTASTQPYADAALAVCFPNTAWTSRLYRQDCEGRRKNLDAVTTTGQVILVDDKASVHVAGQDFYRIPKFDPNKTVDVEMIKLFYSLLFTSLSPKKD